MCAGAQPSSPKELAHGPHELTSHSEIEGRETARTSLAPYRRLSLLSVNSRTLAESDLQVA
jgi:hypothetical protein